MVKRKVLIGVLAAAVLVLVGARARVAASDYYDLTLYSSATFSNAVPTCGAFSYRITATDAGGTQWVDTYAPTSSMLTINGSSLTVDLSDIKAQMASDPHDPVTLAVYAYKKCGGIQESTVAILD